MPAQTVIKLRRDTDANWTSANPTLAAGEAGFESDTGKLKIGDGSTAWTSLGYVSGGASVEVSDTPPSAPEPNTLWWESDTGTLFIYYDGFWVEAVTGLVGPAGADGADNIVVAATAPVDTDVLWVDTSEPGDAVLPLGGTTGQILQKASASDYDTEWANNANVPLSTVTAAGDLIVANGNASVTNLPVGTDGQVLTLTSGAPAWEDAAGGGGMTEITSGTLSGTSLNITSIPQTYKAIRLELTGWSMSSSDRPNLRLNNDSGNDYAYVGIVSNNNSVYSGISNSSIPFGFHDVNTGNGSTIIDVLNYTNASGQKIVVNAQSAYVNTGSQQIAASVTGFYANSAPITQINLFAFASFDSGTYKLWGVS